MWCFAENGTVVGDQDQVVWLSNERGYLRDPQRNVPCIRCKFKQVEILPPNAPSTPMRSSTLCACQAWTGPATHGARKSFTHHRRFSKLWINSNPAPSVRS